MLFVIAAFVVVWALPFWAMVRLASRNPALEQVPSVDDGPSLSVIIPARNESANIATVARSVLASRYRDLELVLVDDRSTDDTLAIMEQVAAGDPRVRVVRGGELPAGWYGKPWACRQGADVARGALLCFTDADTQHEPALLGHAVGALRAGAELITVAPKQICTTFWERVIMPHFWFVLGLRYQPTRVNSSTRTRDVIANGQFILVDRAAYLRAGGHEAVRHEVAEDVALAHAFVRSGSRVRLYFAEPLIATRMYSSLGTIVEGWSKNVYLGARLSFRDEPLLRLLAPLILAAAICFWLVPPALVVAALSGAALPAGVAVGALIATGFAMLFWCFLSFGMQMPMAYGLLYPLGAVMALFIVLRSTLRGGRRVEWRGRIYRDPSLDAPG